MRPSAQESNTIASGNWLPWKISPTPWARPPTQAKVPHTAPRCLKLINFASPGTVIPLTPQRSRLGGCLLTFPETADQRSRPTWAKLVRTLVDGGQCLADVVG